MATHLVARYGINEMAQWYFEVWNEPNINFWTGTQADYFRLFAEAARALKRVSPRLRVGGPVTATGAGNDNMATTVYSMVTTYCLSDVAER